MKKILIFDDVEKSLKKYEKQLRNITDTYGKEGFRVIPLDDSTFKKEIEELKERNRRFLKEKNWEEGHSKIDKADIFVIDYKLIESPTVGLLSGEDFAYLARCFSTCKLIIALNRFGENHFDLSLVGHTDSYADLNIGDRHLKNPGFWSEERNGFRPWHWPILPDFLSNYKKKFQDVKNALETNTVIHRVLGFEKESLLMLSNRALDFLGGDPNTLTFRTFLKFSEIAF